MCSMAAARAGAVGDAVEAVGAAGAGGAENMLCETDRVGVIDMAGAADMADMPRETECAAGAASSETPAAAVACDPEIADEQVYFSVTLGYKGAAFSGFARQPGQLTVQGELEQALSLLFRRQVLTVCAGRTDAGVHARGQVVSFAVGAQELQSRTPRSLVRSLNALTHDDIVVRAVEQHAEPFSARFDAVEREYRYFIATDAQPPLFMADFAWHIAQPLDVDAMREAASLLIGEHDFKSFCLSASAVGKPTCRYVRQISLERQQVMGENMLVITVIGNAFLHSMVRTIVGTLVAVGKGSRTPSWVGQVLAARDRSAAGETAPARGLVFWQVDYEGEPCHYVHAQRGAGAPQAADGA